MAGRTRNRAFGLGMLLLWAIILPAVLGQGCPSIGPGLVESITVGQGAAGSGSSSTPPSLVFTYPLEDVAVTVGEVVTITWTATAQGNAAITLLLDPDRTYGNGNEIVVLPLIMVNTSSGSYNMDTSSLSPSTYRVIGRITDGVNPEQVVASAGRLLLYGAGLLPGNASPTITLSEPSINHGLSQGDTVEISFCGRDIDDDGKDPASAPDIVLMLDLDNDPTNDLDLTGSDGEAILTSICQAGYFPVEIRPDATSPPTAYVLACFTDTDCGETTQIESVDDDGNPIIITQTTPGQTYQFTLDLGSIPPRPDGEPYYVRGLMWDHVNKPVNGYAPGTLSITSLGSGLIDLANVGRTVSGTRFLGLSEGGMAGYTGTKIGDFDSDGADDFIIVSRYGNPYERGNVGTANLIYGLSGQKYASEIPLNSVGTTYRGCEFAMGRTTGTQGITSVTPIDDLNADGKPEIVFGCPYVEVFYDYYDDDNESINLACWGDLMPNPWRDKEGNDNLGAYDWREGTYTVDDFIYLCSNDYDLTRETPINQGYALYVRSDNDLEGSVIELRFVGQHDPDPMGTDEGLAVGASSVPTGARFRGGWWFYDEWDFTQTKYPYSIIPDNGFGQTVTSMPDMSNGSIQARFDDRSELLISAPDGFKTRGAIALIFGQEFGSWSAQPVQSLPNGPRHSQGWPVFRTIVGQSIGDHFGYASNGGDFNLDGSPDILAGSYGADRDGVANVGVVYILFGRLAIGDMDLSQVSPPRVEIHGTRSYDEFGRVQALVGDLNQDGVPDIGLASPYADGAGGVDSGYIGVVFGGRRLTGENIFSVDQVATAQLPGIKFYGIQPNGHAGTVINNAGDFNGDSIDDLLIVAPDEVRTISGVQRQGVAYLIFGGTHMMGNKTYTLSQVGTSDLPGVVFVSPYTNGSADEAPIDWAGAAGDVNGDGFDDILLGISQADYVNPLEPSQRRTDAGEMYLIYGNNTGSNITQ